MAFVIKKHKSRREKSKSMIDKFYNNDYNLTAAQLKTALSFDKQNAANDLGDVTRANYLQIVYTFARKTKKDFEKITKEDVMDFLNSFKEKSSPSTMHQYKISLKKFFAFVFNTKRGVYPACVDWIETRKRERHKDTISKKIISDEEYLRLLKGCVTQRDRAIISFLYFTGARSGEMLNCKIKDLEFDPKGLFVTVTLEGKTGKRQVALRGGISEISEYLKQHSDNDNKNAPLFMTLPNTNRPNQSLGWEGLNAILLELGERVLKRHLHPHLFRHSYATWLALHGYSESEMRVIMGWSKGSPMPAKYTWIKADDVNKKLLVQAGFIESETEEIKDLYKDIKCPRCSTINSMDSKICRSCFFALTKEGADKQAIADKILNKAGIGLTRNELKEVIKEMLKNGEITV